MVGGLGALDGLASVGRRRDRARRRPVRRRLRPSDSAAAEEATRLLARTEGILVDPIYTAKALAGARRPGTGRRVRRPAVVFWHAGGTPGLFEPLDPAEG